MGSLIIRFTCRGIRETGHLQQMIFFLREILQRFHGFDNLHHAEGILEKHRNMQHRFMGQRNVFSV